jgi:hypothetical protein
MRWLWDALRAGARVGVISGVVVGLIAGVGGSLFTGSLLALAALAATVFLLLGVLLPLMFYVSLLNTPPSAQQVQAHAAVAWLSAFLLGVVSFMTPVIMVPFVLGKGVTFDNSAAWYGLVFDQLGIARIILVGVVSALGFALAAASIQRRFSQSSS